MERDSRKKRYCSARCKKAAYRLRKKLRQAPAGQNGCVVCGKPLELDMANEHCCGDRCRKRLERARP